MSYTDGDYSREAMNEARHCVAEDKGKPRPKVGAVCVAPTGDIVGRAHRGEPQPGGRPNGDHAEFILLEKKLPDKDLQGHTVYTTLEPCTRRSPHKTACAQRLIDRQVSRVVIGMLDPNPDVTGKGVMKLRKAGIEVGLFPGDWQGLVEKQNVEFAAPYLPLHEKFMSDLLIDQLRNHLMLSSTFAAMLKSGSLSGKADNHTRSMRIEAGKSLGVVLTHLIAIGKISIEVARQRTKHLEDLIRVEDDGTVSMNLIGQDFPVL